MRGQVRIELRTAAGERLAVREATNAVMQDGARLLAELFAGTGAPPITHMGVGTSDAPESDKFGSTVLTAGDLDGGTETPIVKEAFLVQPADEIQRVVRVRVRGTLASTQAVGTIREAGLLAKDDDTSFLYNRATFAPIEKGGDHELTMFWEISFPYGDLQWLL
jgi:hypothetical protein